MTEQQKRIIQLAARFFVAEIQKNGITPASEWPGHAAVACAKTVVAKAMEPEQ